MISYFIDQISILTIVDGNTPSNNSAQQNSNPLRKNTPGRRKKPCLSSRERNVRRIESNERERLRMHGLNIAFQVLNTVSVICN